MRSQAMLKSKLNRMKDDLDGRSMVSGMSKQSAYSKRTVISGNGSVKTSKTYIS